MNCIIYLFLILSFSVSAQQDIFDVARNGTVEDVRNLMKSNPDIINQKNINGHTPLILASYKGNNEVALYLVEIVKDINAKSDDGTALMAAVVTSNEAVVKALLHKKADVDYADVNGVTALLYAAMFRNDKLVELLVNAGADVSPKDNRGNTALDYAILTKQEKIIQLLKD